MTEQQDSQDRQVTIAGRTLTLRFSLRALKALKGKWGLKTDSEVEAYIKANYEDSDCLIAVLWASALSNHPEITEDAIFDLVDKAGVGGLQEAADSLLRDSSPVPDAEDVADAESPTKAAAP
jgi:hypothetical protein